MARFEPCHGKDACRDDRSPSGNAMTMRQLIVCPSADLKERQHRIVAIRCKGEPHTAVVLRYQGQVYAYLNRCVHMDRRLDCVHDMIFDEQTDHLRCTMHGIVYDPATGDSLSVLCAGERLQSLRTKEIEGQVCIIDKRISAPT